MNTPQSSFINNLAGKINNFSVAPKPVPYSGGQSLVPRPGVTAPTSSNIGATSPYRPGVSAPRPGVTASASTTPKSTFINNQIKTGSTAAPTGNPTGNPTGSPTSGGNTGGTVIGDTSATTTTTPPPVTPMQQYLNAAKAYKDFQTDYQNKQLGAKGRVQSNDAIAGELGLLQERNAVKEQNLQGDVTIAQKGLDEANNEKQQTQAQSNADRTFNEGVREFNEKNNGIGTTGGAYVAGTNPVVDAWVQNINSGKSKLSDITGNPSLKNMVTEGLASSGGNAGDILTTTSQSLKELNDMVDNNNGFTSAVGFKGIQGGFGHPFAGSSAANFDAKLNQVKNDVILPNLTLLHGLGRVTDREFQALTSAVTSLGTNLSEGAFKEELKNITDRIAEKVKEAPTGKNNTQTIPKGTDGAAYGFPGYVSDGTQWVASQ